MTTPTPTLINAQLQGCWLTWAGAVTGCLNALGVACDTADVAGYSGYAFRTIVHKNLCVAAPTVFDWQTLLQGVWKLGRSTVNYCGHECHCAGFINERTIAHSRAAFELAQRETAAGRPCVIWGAYIPEFAVCIGTDSEHYFVDSCRKYMGQPQDPIKWDALNAPGGLYVLGFPTAMKPRDAQTDRAALLYLAQIMAASHAHDDYAWGAAAYDLWIDAIHAGRTQDRFGAGYTAVCWADARRLAHTFIARLAARNDTPAQKPLEAAAAALARSAAALAQIAKIFPFPGVQEKSPDDSHAIPFLQTAQAADAAALAALRQAIAAWPRK